MFKVFAALTPWQKTLVARHPRRPFTLDYIRAMASDFTELHGDRLFSDDKSIVGGFATMPWKKLVSALTLPSLLMTLTLK